jgi:hypothetical protein
MVAETNVSDCKAVAECDSFCDFVRFEANVSNDRSSAQSSISDSSGREKLQSCSVSGDSSGCRDVTSAETLLQKCVRKYVDLFTKFVDVHIVSDNAAVQLFVCQLIESYQLKSAFSASSLDSITDNCSETDCGSAENNRQSKTDMAAIDRIALSSITKNVVEVFNIASQLLVDLSALPVPCDIKQYKNNPVQGMFNTSADCFLYSLRASQ